MRLTDQEKATIKERQKDQIESERRLRKEKKAEERVNADRDDGIGVTDLLFLGRGVACGPRHQERTTGPKVLGYSPSVRAGCCIGHMR
jgi:hypothetical protein